MTACNALDLIHRPPYGGIYEGGKISLETEILQALFRAAMGVDPEHPASQASAPDRPWLGFLAVSAESARAETALLQLFSQGREIKRWRHGPKLSEGPPEPQLMRPGRVYSQIDLPGKGSSERPLRSLKWLIGSEGFGLLTLERRERDFRAVDGQHLSTLLPFLGQALSGWQALRLAQDRAALNDRLAVGLGAGWMVLGFAGNVLDLSPWLRDWIGKSRGLRLRSGRLEFTDPLLGQSFQQAIVSLASSSATARAVKLSRNPPLEMILTKGCHAGESVLIALLRTMRLARRLPVANVASAFDLSRSEARLAMLLCDGFTLVEAAGELGWTLETTRSCSKKIYARMGVSGQQGVLRRILSSPIWLNAELTPGPAVFPRHFVPESAPRLSRR